MTWQVTWYEVIAPDGRFGKQVDTGEFGELNFNFKWKYGRVSSGRADKIGFRATTRIIPLTDKLKIIIGSDDGSRLFFDDKKVIDNWGLQAHTRKTATVSAIPFKPAKLTYEWYEWGGGASAEFEADPMQMQTIMGTFPLNLPPIAKTVDIVAIPFDVFSLVINPNTGEIAADLSNPLDFLKQFLPQKEEKEEKEEEEQEQGKGGGKRTRIVDIEKF